VSIKGARELARGLKHAPRVEWLELREGFHIIPRDRGLSTLADKLVAFFEGAPSTDAATV